MSNIMLDLETMGTRPDAAIVAIGAVEFDPSTRAIGERFYRTVNLASAVAMGGTIDPDTVLWWLRQSDPARAELQRPDRVTLGTALLAFDNWLDDRRDSVCIWGNGAAFDNVILRTAYTNAGTPAPWNHWNDRCYRTLKAMHPGVPLHRTGTHHNAVDDAETQARHLLDILCGPAKSWTVSYSGGQRELTAGMRWRDALTRTTWEIVEPTGESTYSPSGLGGTPCFWCKPVGELHAEAKRWQDNQRADGCIAFCGDSIAAGLLDPDPAAAAPMCGQCGHPEACLSMGCKQARRAAEGTAPHLVV